MADEFIKVILPPKDLLDPRRYLRVVENSLTETARAIKVDFDTTTSSWADRPAFTIESHTGERKVFTDNEIYGYVNRGTAVRHALMEPGFRPKSRRRYIGANKGQGGVVIVSKKIVRPGIEAREFDEAIRAKWHDEFPRQLQRAIDSEAARQARS